MQHNEIDVFYPKDQESWRSWLQENHLSKQAVWVVFYAKKSNIPSITWSEAVDVALCFGWIDSKKISIDKETSHQFFSKRKAKSTWSKVNKDKIEVLMEQGLMTEAGFNSIKTAKENGSWTVLDDVEALIVPADLVAALEQNPTAKNFFFNASKSTKKILLYWLTSAKTAETRQKRLTEIIDSAGQNLKPKHLR
jgi:uncharacterized protein YdeI (YjbR/CyaY-like superfamily)